MSRSLAHSAHAGSQILRRVDSLPVEWQTIRGKPYRISHESCGRMVWLNDRLTLIDDENQTIVPFTDVSYMWAKWLNSGARIEDVRGPHHFFQWFLFESPRDLCRRFHVRVSRRSDQGEYIQVLPIEKADASLFQSATILLDATSHRPRALKVVDPSGREEYVWVFDALSFACSIAAFQMCAKCAFR